MLKVTGAGPEPLHKIWTQAISSALESGKNADDAINVADTVALAYEARFGQQSEEKLNATVKVEIALHYYERHALIGKTAMVSGTIDAPAMGTIRDFSDGGTMFPHSVLIKWTSNGPQDHSESWVSIDKLQLVERLDLSKPVE